MSKPLGKTDLKVGMKLNRDGRDYTVHALHDDQFVVRPEQPAPGEKSEAWFSYKKAAAFTRAAEGKTNGKSNAAANGAGHCPTAPPARRRIDPAPPAKKPLKTKAAVSATPAPKPLPGQRELPFKATEAAAPEEEASSFQRRVLAALKRAEGDSIGSKQRFPRTSSWVTAELMKEPGNPSEPKVREALEALVKAGRVKTVPFGEIGATHYKTV